MHFYFFSTHSQYLEAFEWWEESVATAAAAAKLFQSCPTLCDPRDGSPPGFPFPGILQARTLEWVAISFSNAWEWKVKVKSFSRVRPSVTPWTAAHQPPPSMRFSLMMGVKLFTVGLMLHISKCRRLEWSMFNWLELYPSVYSCLA